MKKSLIKSWRTTLGGVLAGLALAIPEIEAIIDSNPDTIADMNVLFSAVMVMIGLGAARDSGVSSESAGAR